MTGVAEVRVGSRVRVLPGRQFPSFGAGDTGEVRRIDSDARTCEVLFDNSRNGAIPVALRHLCAEDGRALGACNVASVNKVAVSAAEEFMRRGHGAEPERGILTDPAHAASRSGPSFANNVASAPAAVAAGNIFAASLGSTTNSRGLSPPQERESQRRPRSTTPVRQRREAQAFTRQLNWDFEKVDDRMISSPTEASNGHHLASATNPVDVIARLNVLEEQFTRQWIHWEGVEARVASLEEALQSTCGSDGVPAIGFVAARVAALEASHQAEVTELRRGLDDAIALSREQEHQLKRQRSAARETSMVAEESAQRVDALREAVSVLQEELRVLGNGIDGQERRTKSLSDAVNAAGEGLSHLNSLLEAKERRTAALGHAIGEADEGSARIHGVLSGHAQKVREMELKALSLHQDLLVVGSDTGRAGSSVDTEPLWQALRELQELVSRESEQRAAGLREVLVVLGQGVEQLRGEQARQSADNDARSKSEARHVKQKLSEVQTRHESFEKQAAAWEQRIEAFSQALAAERCARAEAVAWMETQVRHARASASPSAPPSAPASPPTPRVGQAVEGPQFMQTHVVEAPPLTPTLAFTGFPNSNVEVQCSGERGRFHSTTSAVTTASTLQRLQALEARYDRPSSVRSLSASIGSRRPLATTTCGSVNKTLGQQYGSRADLSVPMPTTIYTSSSSTSDFMNQVNGGQVMATQFVNVQTGLDSPSYGGTSAVGNFPTAAMSMAPVPAKVVRCYSAPSIHKVRHSLSSQVPRIGGSPEAVSWSRAVQVGSAAGSEYPAPLLHSFAKPTETKDPWPPFERGHEWSAAITAGTGWNACGAVGNLSVTTQAAEPMAVGNAQLQGNYVDSSARDSNWFEALKVAASTAATSTYLDSRSGGERGLVS